MNYKNLNDYELFYLVQDSSTREETINIIFEKYRPLISKIAKQYERYIKSSSCDYDDIIQSGMIGLMSAINSYKESYNVLFFTYASRCIKAQIIKLVLYNNRKKNFIINNAISLDYQKDDEAPIKEYVADEQANLYNLVISKENYSRFLKFKHSLIFTWSCVLELRINGFKYDEISKLLDINKKSVDNILRSIRERIKKNYQII